jgi:hypothetical protein
VSQANLPVNPHADAQLFSPPYLFKGARPVIYSMTVCRTSMPGPSSLRMLRTERTSSSVLKSP